MLEQLAELIVGLDVAHEWSRSRQTCARHHEQGCPRQARAGPHHDRHGTLDGIEFCSMGRACTGHTRQNFLLRGNGDVEGCHGRCAVMPPSPPRTKTDVVDRELRRVACIWDKADVACDSCNPPLFISWGRAGCRTRGYRWQALSSCSYC
jgi:hypothetical protein